MTQRFFVPGRFPGLNDYVAAINRNRYVGNTMKREYTGVVNRAAMVARLSPVTGPVELLITWCEPNAKRDPDNIVFAKKFLLDGLVEAGILPNDTQAHIKGFTESWRVVPKIDLVGVDVTITEAQINA